jgi:hypothetical protein
MMAADYDQNSRPVYEAHRHRHIHDSSHQFRNHHHGRTGKGKGRNFGQHTRDNSSNLRDFILPEMLVDPWIDLYHTLPEQLQYKETVHLSAEERDRVECNRQLYPNAKRQNLD